jgi:hypothetical protein
MNTCSKCTRPSPMPQCTVCRLPVKGTAYSLRSRKPLTARHQVSRAAVCVAFTSRTSRAGNASMCPSAPRAAAAGATVEGSQPAPRSRASLPLHRLRLLGRRRETLRDLLCSRQWVPSLLSTLHWMRSTLGRVPYQCCCAGRPEGLALVPRGFCVYRSASSSAGARSPMFVMYIRMVCLCNRTVCTL